MTNWRKSSRSGLETNCVWVWPGATTHWIKDENKTVLVVWNEDWRAFINHIKKH